MNILVVCAHPDDETIGMGGTLKKLAKNHKIKVIFLTDGITGRRKSGYVNLPKYEIADKEMKKMKREVEIRKKHAKQALKIFGIKEMTFLELPNQELDKVPILKIIKVIEREIELTKCNVIFTHHYNDLNIDHRIAYEATITAARPLPWSNVSSIFSFEIPASTDWRYPYKFNSNMFIEISNELKSKLRALKAYNYEIRKSPHPRSEEMTVAVAKRWGSLAGMIAAEAFEVIMTRIDKSKNSFFSIK